MKAIHITSSNYDADIIIDQIAYITATIEPAGYTIVLLDGKSINIDEETYNEIKSYIMQ